MTINSWKAKTYDVELYDFDTDLNKLTGEEIHNFVVESMYYANMSENVSVLFKIVNYVSVINR